MDTKARNEAHACLMAIGELSDRAGATMYGEGLQEHLVPIRVLLDHAVGLVDGKDTARDKKNAGDRARRAKSKAPGKKPRKKNPRGRAKPFVPAGPPAA